MTREQADQVVREMLANQIGMMPVSIDDYWVTARGLRVRYVGTRLANLELTQEGLIPMPRAEAQALVDAGGE